MTSEFITLLCDLIQRKAQIRHDVLEALLERVRKVHDAVRTITIWSVKDDLIQTILLLWTGGDASKSLFQEVIGQSDG